MNFYKYNIIVFNYPRSQRSFYNSIAMNSELVIEKLTMTYNYEAVFHHRALYWSSLTTL